MNPEHIDRRRLKSDMKDIVRTAQVSARTMTALYLGLSLVLSLVDYAGSARGGALSVFLSILTTLLAVVLGAGFVMYCMAILRGERAEYLSLFDGFSIAGKFIALYIVQICFITLWSMLFVVPGIIAMYRYRFAEYNLFENPDLGVFQCLDMSKRQTAGYKMQLFMLDVSYFGWACAAALPVMVESFLYSYASAAGMLGIESNIPVFTETTYFFWMIFTGIWQIVVSMFYLPAYQCTELAYYEIAKSTSGIDPDQFRIPTPDGL
ncbi:MAG: DUF975 family protein [Oscillibacter sp.]|nr:DUF975 family protein [Oscillibacter sp.]